MHASLCTVAFVCRTALIQPVTPSPDKPHALPTPSDHTPRAFGSQMYLCSCNCMRTRSASSRIQFARSTG